MTKPSLLDLKVPEKFNQLLPKSKIQVLKKRKSPAEDFCKWLV
ncbi:hypothetical protein [Anabaena sp. UHCC 0253]|nr:hypothetical protein [Anabaena sp. UHCC 0253]